ncbi:MAG: tripartite tricarboxylate transporter TctB family protein [Synergistaceae bacterium]|jgi:membrane-associated HD superfamily phosphohydrolase|nr:tripartite tricarboxylate transporter TctB family protein [Synergistaceae bacterium]
MTKYLDEYLPIAFLYALSAYFWWDVEDFTADSLMYPRALVGVLLVLTTLLLVFTLMKKMRLPQSKDENSPFKFCVVLAASIVYVFAVPFLGFAVSSLLYAPATALLLGYKRKGMVFFVSILTVVLIYIGFRTVLKVPLPTVTLLGMTL